MKNAESAISSDPSIRKGSFRINWSEEKVRKMSQFLEKKIVSLGIFLHNQIFELSEIY